MKIVEPSVKIITEPNPLKRVEIAGRTCWQSEGKMTEDSALPFVQRLIARGHMTPLEHARIVVGNEKYYLMDHNREYPYGLNDRTKFIHATGYRINIRDYLAIGGDIQRVADGKFPMADDFMTVGFICDRAIANELVRHRIFSFCQTSTRYVCYSGDIEFVLPVPFDKYETGEETLWCWRRCCERAEASYHELLSLGSSPQEARNVLPLSLKTELVMTGLNSDWQTLIEMRSDKAAHPQMQYLMKLLKEEMEKTNV